MKKILISSAMLALVAGLATFTGCKKDDKTAPVVTLKGSATESATLNTVYADPGATAKDDIDGDLSTKIVVTGTVNKDLKGSYTLTYTATDAAGNSGKATRTVDVKNSSENLAGTYNTTDNNPAISGNYTITITTSSTVNNKIVIANLGKYGASATADATVSGTTLTIASQTVTYTICSAPITGTIATTASGTVNIGTTITMTIPYKFTATSPSTFCGTATTDAGTASLTK